MTTETTNNAGAKTGGNKPTHVAKLRIGHGKQATYERIGVAWVKEDGAVFVKLHGTQIVSEGFSLYPVAAEEGAR